MKSVFTTVILACSALACGLAFLPNVLPISWLPLLSSGKLALQTLCSAADPRLGVPVPGPSIVNHPSGPAQAPEPKKPVDTHAIIRAAAKKHGVPTAFVESIVAAESNFNYSAVSPKGAVGLMQLMPKTADEFGADPSNPEQNVDAGTRYLRVLMDRYRYHNHCNSLK